MEVKVEPFDASIEGLGYMSESTGKCPLSIKTEAPVNNYIEVKRETFSGYNSGKSFFPQIKREVNVDDHIDRCNDTSHNIQEIILGHSRPNIYDIDDRRYGYANHCETSLNKLEKLYKSNTEKIESDEREYEITVHEEESNVKFKNLPQPAEPSSDVCNLVKTEVVSECWIQGDDLNTSMGILPTPVKAEVLIVGQMDYNCTLPEYEVEFNAPGLKDEYTKRTIPADG